jgi:uncharacterized protein (TIGR00661 family)
MTLQGKKILFAVQGEGRGHLTQAITMQNILTEAGYEIVGVLLGVSGARKIPDFFYEQIKAPITTFASPNFVTDNNQKSIRILPSITRNLLKVPTFFKNMRMVGQTIKKLDPDLVINFYDPLIGMFFMLFNHPQFQFPKGFLPEKITLQVFTRLTGSRAIKKLALSMYPLQDVHKGRIVVMPPLLRSDVSKYPVTDGNYILIYLLNAGYMDEIIKWHKSHPEVVLHCFTDKKDIEGEWKYDGTLSFHQINDKKFLSLMAGASALACTAGFESICEALYFGKPVYMVPVASHFEQYSNARDAARAGAGIYGTEFNLDNLIAYLPNHHTNPEIFRAWADHAKPLLLKHLENVLNPPMKAKIGPALYR